MVYFLTIFCGVLLVLNIVLIPSSFQGSFFNKLLGTTFLGSIFLSPIAFVLSLISLFIAKKGNKKSDAKWSLVCSIASFSLIVLFYLFLFIYRIYFLG